MADRQKRLYSGGRSLNSTPETVGNGHKTMLTAKEAAAILNVSPGWVYAHAKGERRPVLPAFRAGRLVRIHPDDLEAFRKEYTGIAE